MVCKVSSYFRVALFALVLAVVSLGVTQDTTTDTTTPAGVERDNDFNLGWLGLIGLLGLAGLRRPKQVINTGTPQASR
jgi:MYXO-CTERM domain-containing protein